MPDPPICGAAAFWVPLAPDNSNAFNPCFLCIIVFLLAIVVFAFGGYDIVSSKRLPSYGTLAPKNTGLTHYIRVFAVSIHALLYAYLVTYYLSIHERFADNKLIGFGTFTAVLFAIVLPLHTIENLYFTNALDILLVFWPLVVIWQVCLWYQDTFTAWKLIKLPDHYTQIHAVEVFLVINAIFIFILEFRFWKPSKTLVYEYTKRGDAKLLQKPNIIDRETFMWMNPLIVDSHKNQQVLHTELPNSPVKLSTRELANRLLLKWIPGERSIASLLFRAFGPKACYSFGFEFLSRLPNFIQPQLLRILIRYFNEENAPILKGILISFGMLLNTLAQTVLYGNYVLLNLEVGLSCRSSLTSLIYEQALLLSTEARKSYSSGDIINLISVDVNKVQELTMDISTLILMPSDVILCLISLWPLLGMATLSAVVVIVVLTPANVFVTKWYKKKNKAYMKLKDYRTRVINEILMSIKSIKLFAWEKPMFAKLHEARVKREMHDYFVMRLGSQVANYIWILIPVLVSLTSFSTFALFDKRPLTSDIVFPALALLNLLSLPLFEIPSIITMLVEAITSMGRINLYLVASKMDPHMTKRTMEPKEIGDVTVSVRNMDFLWSPNNYALKDINFVAKKGQLSCIVGKVGSGKSAFLYGLLGQLTMKKGDSSDTENQAAVTLHGSIAYCSQQSWIMNASVKENILFGARFDKDFYEKTLDACQLLADLQILPDGDNTEVGEKGVSLSGGQKARLALARAVYARADIYLLDDVLSAVDSHVGKNIIKKVLSSSGLLKSKTVVLVTNSIPVLSYSNLITMIKNQTIGETASYRYIDEDHHPDIYKLISEFGREEKDDDESTEEATEDDDIKTDLNPESLVTSSSSVSSISGTSLRRASIATFNWEPIKKLLPNLRSGQTNEVLAKGKVKWSVYLAYMKACSVPGVILFVFLLVTASVLSVGGNYWLKHWAEENSKNNGNENVWKFIIVYALFGFGQSMFQVLRSIVAMLWIAINASIKIHDDMAKRVLRAPMSFFERTPLGRIMNRFTNDIQKLDSSIPATFSRFFNMGLRTIMTLCVVGFAMPAYVLIILGLLTLYVYYQVYYVSVSRSLKRLVAISRSPIYAHLGESLNGLDTIRAYNQVDRFDFINHANVDFNLKSVYMIRLINRWLLFRLQCIGSLGIFSASSLAVFSLTTLHPLTPSMAGFVMTYALQVTLSLQLVVRVSAEVETNVVAVERCIEYCELPVEEPDDVSKLIKPPVNWTQNGSIKFHNYSTRYRENLDLILRNITMEIKEGEKIGVVGRTGAGKSSLALSIFRIIEPVTGYIEIDGLNTSLILLFDLRRHLGIIPQDSQLIEGTIRQNLDPFNYYTEEELWKALELAHLKDHIEQMQQDDDKDNDNADKLCHKEPVSKLDLKVYEGGSNFSLGQRQLMSLARVLLRMKDSNILILDEATAAIDVETDKIIQETIRKEFKEKTIITIAHRLETVMDLDRILSLDKGEIVEFDSPQVLLEQKNEEGVFYRLCKQAGLT